MKTIRVSLLILATVWWSSAMHAMSVVTDLSIDDDPGLAAETAAVDPMGPDPDPNYPWAVNVTAEYIVGQRGNYVNEIASATMGGVDIMVGYNNTGLLTNNVSFVISRDAGQDWRVAYTPVSLANPYAAYQDQIYSSDPSATTCTTGYGHHLFLGAFVTFGNDFLQSAVPGHFNCTADNTMAMTATQDFGVHWRRVHAIDAGPGLFRDRPMLECDPASARCWAMFNGYVPDSDGACDESAKAVYLATSTDCGDTWSVPYEVGQDHLAPTNVTVRQNGRAVFGYWRTNTDLDIVGCDATGGIHCITLKDFHNIFLPTQSDHAKLNGLPYTRLNSMPVSACDPTDTRCTVAWMAQFGEFQGAIYQARVMYTTTLDGGATWSDATFAPETNGYNPDQFLPMVDWGNKRPGLCWYQREVPVGNAGDHTIHVVCSRSPDGGLTWTTPVEISDPIFLSTEPTLQAQSFLGDYNHGLNAKGGWVWFTHMLWPPPGTTPNIPKPYARSGSWTPDGCQLGPARAGGGWLLLAPLFLLLRRRGRSLLFLLLACGLLAMPMLVRAQEDPCVGDCNGDGAVLINELITGVNIALGEKSADSCPGFFDSEGNFLGVNILTMTQAVANSLDGCPQPTPPTPTPEPTQ